MKKLEYLLTTLEEVRSQLDTSKPVALDVETKGLYGEIQLAQFYQKHWPQALLVEKPELIELFSLTKTLHLVCHNVAYEISTLQTQLGKMFDEPCRHFHQEDWDDTLLLAKLQFFDKERYSLDECYKHALKFDPYEAHGLDKKAMQKCDWSVLTEPKLEYAACDVFYLLELYDKCETWLDSSAYQLDKSATNKAFEFQTNGLPISYERIDALITKHEKRIEEIGVPINVNSWQQVRPYIGESESDGLALATFALEGNDKARNVQESRKLLKQVSFLNKYKDKAFEGRIYGKFTFTTKSGRGNCKDQNLQQLPRDTKEVFEAEEGNVFVMSDYAQLELRYGCAHTGEPAMEERFKSGEDLHQYTADTMNVKRQYAKTCNFNLLYGGSANMLRSIFIEKGDVLLPIQEVRVLKKKWHSLWRVLTRWQDETTTKWRNGDHFETVLGRKFKSKLYTDAMNLPISGGSADIAKLAMHKMFKELDKHSELAKQCKFVNFVHDSFMWECPDDKAVYEPLARITAQAMKEAWEELVVYTKIPDLPMPVDVAVGYNWGDIEYGREEAKYSLTL